MDPAQDAVAVHVAPIDHPWADAVGRAAVAGGARLVGPTEAAAIVWLASPTEGDLSSVLSDRVRWVQLRSAGIEALLSRGVIDDTRQWSAAQGIYAHSVAEHALALLLAGIKLLPRYARASSWDPAAKEQGQLVRDSTVAVVGAGGVGQELIRYLQTLGPRIVAVTRTGHDVPGADVCLPATALEQVWPSADVVVLCAPATPRTRHLIDARALEALPRHALLVNIARGALIDTEALVAALALERIGGAALDVTDPEPLPEGHPLWTDPRVLLTPHAANPAAAQLPRLCTLVEENVHRFARGAELLGTIDHVAGY